MCGRYYIDDETAREIEKIVRQVNDRLLVANTREIHPSERAPVIMAQGKQLAVEEYRWGFPHFDQKKKGVIFNARSETVMSKPMFRESVIKRRCVIPATGFYEWDSDKNQYSFRAGDGQQLLFAGLYNRYAGEERFVILTTSADDSMSAIHDRMPLILPKEAVERWVFEDEAVGSLLGAKHLGLVWEVVGEVKGKVPGKIKGQTKAQVKSGVEGQISLFD
jgi:putative SOS response-associated peptidase YedK